MLAVKLGFVGSSREIQRRQSAHSYVYRMNLNMRQGVIS